MSEDRNVLTLPQLLRNPDNSRSCGPDRSLPSDFVQVNAEINNKIVALVIDALACHSDMHVLELFCGLGNFTLPIAKQVLTVTAVEGEASLIERAKRNAEKNNINNVAYHVANLMDDVSGLP